MEKHCLLLGSEILFLDSKLDMKGYRIMECVDAFPVCTCHRGIMATGPGSSSFMILLEGHSDSE